MVRETTGHTITRGHIKVTISNSPSELDSISIHNLTGLHGDSLLKTCET